MHNAFSTHHTINSKIDGGTEKGGFGAEKGGFRAEKGGFAAVELHRTEDQCARVKWQILK